jgi:hypothetical protein
MTDWTTLDLNGLLPGEPWTSAKALAVYENPIAIAEAAAGAPRLDPKAMAGNRLLAFGGGAATWAGLTDLGLVAELFLSGHVDLIGDTIDPRSFQVRFSNDNGSNWGTVQNLFTITAATPADEAVGGLAISLNMVTGACSVAPPFSAAANPTLTVPDAANAVQFRVQSGDHFRLCALITGGR